MGDISKIPPKWHLCDGTDGTPDLTDRFLEGTIATPGMFKEPGLPNISGTFQLDSRYNFSDYATGVFKVQSFSQPWYQFDGGPNWIGTIVYQFDANKINPIYGASTTVQPKAYTVMYIIKVK